MLTGQAEAAKARTYRLIKGKCLGGNVADPNLNELSFDEIAEELALNLQLQNYYSEENPDAGDLLIMVHYGASTFIGGQADADVFDIHDYLPPVENANGEVYEYELAKNAIPQFLDDVLPSERTQLNELNFVAGHYFGKNMKGLISKRATDESLVEMGEIEVIEEDEPN